LGAQLANTDLRQRLRYTVDYAAKAEHRTFGDTRLVISNISRSGFMVEARNGIERGDRLEVTLPTVGRIESFCIWKLGQRAGFQFERPIRPDDFEVMVEPMQPVRRAAHRSHRDPNPR
jgi:hypothetical protein